MKKTVKRLYVYLSYLLLLGLPHIVLAQSEAGGLFLLISPGARAASMGEAQVAVANDAYTTYWNPAGLSFLTGSEVAMMHMKWLPGLANDIYYEFFAFGTNLGKFGGFGIHAAYLSLGEQIHTGQTGPEKLSTFRSYMWYGSFAYSLPVNPRSSFGVNVKIYRQFLAPAEVMESQLDAMSTGFAIDLAYLHRHLFFDQLTFGAMLSNVGPNIKFYNTATADPAPTTLRIGWDVELLRFQNIRCHIAYDVSKRLVTRNTAGQPLPLQQSIFQTWTDEPLHTELTQLLHNFGGEIWLFNILALRAGGFYQSEGNLHMPDNSPILTFGVGLRFANYGLDLGYISATTYHPLNNTIRVSFNARI